VRAPTSYQLNGTYGPTASEVTTSYTTVSVTATPWRADILKTARWHKPIMYFANSSQSPIIIDVMLEVEKAGNQ
jgi:hypothetical protein